MTVTPCESQFSTSCNPTATYPGSVAGNGQRLRVLVVLSSDKRAGQVTASGRASIRVGKGEDNLGGSQEGVDKTSGVSDSLACSP
jgi:hypothetical protein